MFASRREGFEFLFVTFSHSDSMSHFLISDRCPWILRPSWCCSAYQETVTPSLLAKGGRRSPTWYRGHCRFLGCFLICRPFERENRKKGSWEIVLNINSHSICVIVAPRSTAACSWRKFFWHTRRSLVLALRSTRSAQKGQRYSFLQLTRSGHGLNGTKKSALRRLFEERKTHERRDQLERANDPRGGQAVPKERGKIIKIYLSLSRCNWILSGESLSLS